jgi:hypothetical protein
MDGWWTSNRETWHYKQIELPVLEFVTDQGAHSMLDITPLEKKSGKADGIGKGASSKFMDL